MMSITHSGSFLSVEDISLSESDIVEGGIMTESVLEQLIERSQDESDQGLSHILSTSSRPELAQNAWGLPTIQRAVDDLARKLTWNSKCERSNKAVRALGVVSKQLGGLIRISMNHANRIRPNNPLNPGQLHDFVDQISRAWSRIPSRPKSTSWRRPSTWFRKEDCLVPDHDAILDLGKILTKFENFLCTSTPDEAVVAMRSETRLRINTALDGGSAKVGFSTISIKQMDGVFRIYSYKQECEKVPILVVRAINEYSNLLYLSLGCPLDVSASEATRFHYISIIVNLVVGVTPGVRAYCERPLAGIDIHAHGRFELVLARGDRVLCIVEAKKFDLRAGIFQALVGTEVAAEGPNSRTVYGIVSTYEKWSFIRNRYDGVATDFYVGNIIDGRLTSESVEVIVGKIYSMLTDPCVY